MFGLRARQVVLSDLIEFDLILAMDRANLADLQRMQQQAIQHNPAQGWLRYWQALDRSR